MKRMRYGFFIFAVAAVIFCSVMIFDLDRAERKLCEAGIYDKLDGELIEMYEREIAGESVVSDKSTAQLQRSAGRLGVEINKLKALMLLQDLASKVGRDISLSELAAMNDFKLIGFVKQCADEYLDTLPQERQKELKDMLKSAIKI